MPNTNNRRGGGTAVCRYYLSNACKYGNSCLFSHDRSQQQNRVGAGSGSAAATGLSPNSVCVFYRSGSCSFGNNCRYSHSDAVQLATFDGRPASAAAAVTDDSNDVHSSSFAQPSISSSSAGSRLRAEAPEFVPRSNPSDGITSVSDMAARMDELTMSLNEQIPSNSNTSAAGGNKNKVQLKYDALCPYYVKGNCWYAADVCQFVHGNPCDFCNEPALHPNDKRQRAEHIRQCSERFEKEMDQAFADAASDRSKEISKEKMCGICMELVVEKKELSERRFGILPNCKHVFCLCCIRKWRCSRSFETNIIRACPECRTKSDFVVPSLVWADEEKEKGALITHYKKQCKQKHCKYFKRGTAQAECPFGNQCFYRHEKPDGTIVQGDSPRTVRRRIQASQAVNGGGRRRQPYVMWDFLTADDDFEDVNWDEGGWMNSDDEWDTDSILSMDGAQLFELETDISSIIERIDHLDWSAMLRGQAAQFDIGYMGDDVSDAQFSDTDNSSIDWDATLSMWAAAESGNNNSNSNNVSRSRTTSASSNPDTLTSWRGRGRRHRRGANVNSHANARTTAANRRTTNTGATSSTAHAATSSDTASHRVPPSAASTRARASSRQLNPPWTSDITRWWNREMAGGGGSGRSSVSSGGDNPWSFGSRSHATEWQRGASTRYRNPESGRSHSNSTQRQQRQPRNSTGGLMGLRQASNMSLSSRGSTAANRGLIFERLKHGRLAAAGINNDVVIISKTNALMEYEQEEASDEDVARELIEFVRLHTDVSYSKACTTIQGVLKLLTLSRKACTHIEPVEAVAHNDLLDVETCSDAIRLGEYLQAIGNAKDDVQERSWSLHEDVDMITDTLDSLAKLVQLCDRRVALHVLPLDDYSRLQDLVLLYQMETRAIVRERLLSCLCVLAELDCTVANILLNTVLPVEVANTLNGPASFREAACTRYSLQLLTTLFATAQQWPYSHYDVITVDWLLLIMTEIESDSWCAMECTRLLLALHTHQIRQPDALLTSVVNTAHGTAHFMEHVLLMLNRDVDPIWPWMEHQPVYSHSCVLAMHDLLLNVQQPDNLLYSQDVIVLVDVLLRKCNDLTPASTSREDAFGLLQVVCDRLCDSIKVRIGPIMDCARHCQLDEDNASEQERDLARAIIDALQSADDEQL